MCIINRHFLILFQDIYSRIKKIQFSNQKDGVSTRFSGIVDFESRNHNL